MTLKLPIFKVHLNVADQNTSHYADYNLTIAHDPGLGEHNLITKICIYSYLSNKGVEFTRESFMEDLPFFTSYGPDSNLDFCADLGQLTAKKLKHMGHHAKESVLFLHDDELSLNWLKNEEVLIRKFKTMSVYKIHSPEYELALTRSFSPSVSIDGEDIYISIGEDNLVYKFEKII